jgi:hypothetical protein
VLVRTRDLRLLKFSPELGNLNLNACPMPSTLVMIWATRWLVKGINLLGIHLAPYVQISRSHLTTAVRNGRVSAFTDIGINL